MARHPGVTNLLRWFKSDHLLSHLRPVGIVMESTASDLVNMIPVDSPELTEGLRKLLEAKDCFVRATIIAKEASA